MKTVFRLREQSVLHLSGEGRLEPSLPRLMRAPILEAELQSGTFAFDLSARAQKI
jgi:hypothetical protein